MSTMTNRIYTFWISTCLAGSLGIVAAETGFPLMSNCFDDAERVAVVSASDPVKVRYASAAGAAKSCYAVQVSKDGRSVSGFPVGATLPAIDQLKGSDLPSTHPARPLPPRASNGEIGSVLRLLLISTWSIAA